MAIDGDLTIWPYQSLKALLMNAAVRARTRAEWNRNTDNPASREIREIDRELSQVDKDLTEEEKNMLGAALMGGNQAKCEIAKYNEDIDRTCNYCKEADSTTDHIRWICTHTSSGSGKS